MGAPPGHLHDFVKMRPGAEAVLQRIGRLTWDLLLVAPDGSWVREVLETPEEAETICMALGVRVSRGWGDPRLARRMNSRDHWTAPGGQRRAL